MDYERGLEQLKQRLHGTAWEQDFQVYEARLRENLRIEQLYGTNAQQKVDRAQIINQLNRLAQQVNVSFNDLCLGGNVPNPQPVPRPYHVTGNVQPNVLPTPAGNFPGSVMTQPNFPNQEHRNNSSNAAHNSVQSSTTSNSFWQRHGWKIVAIAIVSTLLAVIFASTTLYYLLITRPSPVSNGAIEAQTTAVSHTPTNVPSAQIPTGTAAPTVASTVAAGTVLCQYDISKGFSGWNNSPQWNQVNGGPLGSAGTDNGQGVNNNFAWSGCQLPTVNYAVEAQIQFVRVNNNGGSYEFGIIVRGDGNASGYEVGVGAYTPLFSTCGNAVQQAIVTLVQNDQAASDNCGNYDLNPLSGPGATRNYLVDPNWHTYRAEITGNTIRLFIDGTKLLETSDNTFTNAGKVGLRDFYGDINVKSFTVRAL